MSDHSNNIKKQFKPPYENMDKYEQEHANEHKKWDRRSFFRTMGLGVGGVMMLGKMQVTAASMSPLSAALSAANPDRILVLVRLKGGNDGLNTIIPLYDYDTYANNRPTLRISQSDTFSLSNDFAMPDFMNTLEPFWGDGKMKVVHGVGYEGQNLSHFRSSDIWATGSDVDEVIDSGFMGRYYESQYPDFLSNPPEEPLAIQIGSVGNLMFTGSDFTSYAFSVADPEQLYQLAQNGWLHDVNNLPDCLYGEQLGFLRAITNSTLNYAGVINDAYTAVTNDVSYDNSHLSNQLALIARLIKGGLGTRVYMVSLGGFDTHALQVDMHERLLTDLANGISSFFGDMAASGRENDIMCMTFSEFGRRVAENASDGTDHGAAAPSLFFGPGLNGSGFIGQHPSLTDLDNAGNLQLNIDYRQLYASVMQDWLCIPSDIVDTTLLGVPYDRLNLGFECLTSVPEQEKPGLTHRPVYMPDGEVFIEYELPSSMHVQVLILDIMGRKIAQLDNGSKLPGKHKVAIRANSGHLAKGPYMYRIIADGNSFSRSVFLTR